MSLSCASLTSISPPPPPTLAPKTLDCLLTRIVEGGPPKPLTPLGDSGGDAGRLLCVRMVEDELRRPKPNLLPGFGGRGLSGRGGGRSSELPVLPV